MSVIDVEKLLQPTSDSAPCGPSLQYGDRAFSELKIASEGKPEKVMGESVIPAEEPDWKDVKKRALELCGRTKDLRIAEVLTRALLKTDSWQGLQDGLAYVHGLIERYWDGVHPELDPDDNRDPTQRVNILASLSGAEMLKSIRETPLVESRQLGRFSLRDVLIATGKVQAPAGDKVPPTAADIEAAFMAVEVEDLQARDAALSASVEWVRTSEQVLGEKLAGAPSADFAELASALKAARAPILTILGRRVGVGDDAGLAGDVAAGVAPGRASSGEIATRDDAIRMLERICDYFQRNEPSSPVPILLLRAKRLVSKSFVDIIRDLAPGGLAEVESIRGQE